MFVACITVIIMTYVTLHNTITLLTLEGTQLWCSRLKVLVDLAVRMRWWECVKYFEREGRVPVDKTIVDTGHHTDTRGPDKKSL